MRTAHFFGVLGLALSLIALPAATGCLVEPEFTPPQIALVPRVIAVDVPAPKFRTRPPLVVMGWGCGGALVLPETPHVDGLIDLFGSVANFRTAVSSDSVSFAFDDRTITLPCGLGGLGSPETPNTDRLRKLLLDDASYDWDGESCEEMEPHFTAHFTFSSQAPTVVAEIAPRSGTVRILVDQRETGRATLHLSPLELEELLTATRAEHDSR